MTTFSNAFDWGEPYNNSIVAETPKPRNIDEALNQIHKRYRFCPNTNNPYHECSWYCIERYGPPQSTFYNGQQLQLFELTVCNDPKEHCCNPQCIGIRKKLVYIPGVIPGQSHIIKNPIYFALPDEDCLPPLLEKSYTNNAVK